MSRWLVSLLGACALAVGFLIGIAIMTYAFPHVGAPAPQAPVQVGTSQSARQAPASRPGKPRRPEPATYHAPAPIESPPASNALESPLRPSARPTLPDTRPASARPSPRATVSVSATRAPSPSPSPSPDPTPDLSPTESLP